MIILDVEQNSPEWLMARLGIPTASKYDKLLTSKRLQLSAQRFGYRDQLLAEWLLGHPIDWGGSSEFMERGTRLEPEARAWYEFDRDVEVETVGFCQRDDALTGGSPDGLVGTDGGLEIKCPAINTHIGILLDPAGFEDSYRHQVQGCLYLTGRAWWDLMAYHPELPPVVRRVERDEDYIAALDAALDTFLAELNEAKEQLAEYRTERAVAA